MPDILALDLGTQIPLISLKRILFSILAILFIIRILRLKSVRQNLQKVLFLKEILILLASLSLITLVNFNNSQGILNYISIMVEQFGLYVIIWVTLDEKEIINTFKWILVSFTIITVYGIYEKLTGSNPFIDMMPEHFSRTLIYSYADEIRAGILGRVQSTFVHPITYGAYLAMILPFCIINLIKSISIKRIPYLIMCMFILSNILMTGSRSPIVFSLIILSGLAYYLEFKNRIIYLCFSIGIGVLLVGTILSDYLEILAASLMFWQDRPDIAGSSVSVRLDMITAAYGIFKENIFFGLGLTALRQMVVESKFTSELGGGESIIISYLIELGIIGSIGYILFYNRIYQWLSRNIRKVNGIIARDYLVCMISIFFGIIVFWVMTNDMGSFYYFLILLSLTTKLTVADSLKNDLSVYPRKAFKQFLPRKTGS